MVARHTSVLGKSGKAFAKWGGCNYSGQSQESIKFKTAQQNNETLRGKWVPKRENWEGVVADTDDKGFGVLHPGHEVEALVEMSKNPELKSKKEWQSGVVLAIDRVEPGEEEGRRKGKVAVLVESFGSTDFVLGAGHIRRQIDARELVPPKELDEITRLRTNGNVQGLVRYASSLPSVPGRSHALVTLSRMGQVHKAQPLIEKDPERFSSVAMREAAHAFARTGDVELALQFVELLPQVGAAQLVLEVLALAVTHVLQEERKRFGKDVLYSDEENEAIMRMIRHVQEEITRLDQYLEAVQRMPPTANRMGLQDAFNELLMSCGRAHAVPVAFLVLEYMEGCKIPKSHFTYEAIGLNVVKTVTMARKVWDLPMMPEEACPEVVFAGRSNVGKSSLVNMLLNRVALAPTSVRPGKTKTMDFFDVNAGHPALPRFRLVDVPGLGFARASKDLRQRWVQLIGGYFVQRQSLKLVFHLLDAGLCQILPADRDLWRLLAQAQRKDFELCICLTKSDNSLPAQMERFAHNVREALRSEGSDLAMNATIFACSSKSKMGKDTLWRKIWKVVGGESIMQYGPLTLRKEEMLDVDYTETELQEMKEKGVKWVPYSERPKGLQQQLKRMRKGRELQPIIGGT